MLCEVAQGRRTVLVPKNGGLIAQAARTLATLGIPEDAIQCNLRGEDIPYVANELAREGRVITALTGEDLLADWMAAGNSLDGRLATRIVPWASEDAMFGKPALCLIGGPDSELASLPESRVAVCARYKNLAAGFLAGHDVSSGRLRIATIQGALEEMLTHGLADFIIDVVLTGRTVRENGLKIQAVICKSDLAVLETT
jgi:ATP phosphoribosyltransferase